MFCNCILYKILLIPSLFAIDVNINVNIYTMLIKISKYEDMIKLINK